MELITAESITYHNGYKSILEEASFRILDGQRCGLVGPNGVGKTTLIRLLLGEHRIDHGKLEMKEGLRIGHVPQNPVFTPGESIEEFMLADLAETEAHLHELEAALATVSEEDSRRLLDDYQATLERFEARGGYEAGERIDTILTSLGLDNERTQSMESLSGGERSLVYFAQALLGSPELLILDEPGNHLDFLGLAWLEAFLAGFKGAVLIVSHNRYLLDRVCTLILELRNGKMSSFTGNYSGYRTEKLRSAVIAQSEYLASQKAIAELDKKVKQLGSIVSSQYNPPATICAQYAAAKRKLAQEREKNLERPQINGITMNLSLDGEQTKSDFALQIRDYSRAFGERILFDGASVSLKCGERAALVGPNGCGKTTLVSEIAERASWDDATLRIPPSQRIGYLSQVPVFAEDAVTLEDEVRSWGPLSRDGAFNLVAPFLFTWDDMEKSVAVLSGGEKNRLQIARLLYQNANFLLLDEPTNHMDIESREVIEEALIQFRGTILVVSHDRYFLDRVATSIIEVDDHRLTTHSGNFTEFFRRKYPVLPRMKGGLAERSRVRKAPAKTAAKTAGKDLAKIEQRIEEDEKRKSSLESLIQAAFESRDHKKGRELSAQLEELNRVLERHYKEWENYA